MPDHISLMLDSMILAVDEGLSYDGIVSIPEIGLEDVGYRARPAGLLNDGVELLRSTGAAISRGVVRFFNNSPRRQESPAPDPPPQMEEDTRVQAPHSRSPSATEGGTGSQSSLPAQGSLPSGSDQQVPNTDMKSPRKRVEETERQESEEGIQAHETLPSNSGEQVPNTDLKSPRKKVEEVLGETERQESEEGIQAQETLPSNSGEQVPNTHPKSPRKKVEEVPGDITHPDEGRDPRKRKEEAENTRDPRKRVR